jgi:hypothetical protein
MIKARIPFSVRFLLPFCLVFCTLVFNSGGVEAKKARKNACTAKNPAACAASCDHGNWVDCGVLGQAYLLGKKVKADPLRATLRLVDACYKVSIETPAPVYRYCAMLSDAAAHALIKVVQSNPEAPPPRLMDPELIKALSPRKWRYIINASAMVISAKAKPKRKALVIRYEPERKVKSRHLISTKSGDITLELTMRQGGIVSLDFGGKPIRESIVAGAQKKYGKLFRDVHSAVTDSDVDKLKGLFSKPKDVKLPKDRLDKWQAGLAKLGPMTEVKVDAHKMSDDGKEESVEFIVFRGKVKVRWTLKVDADGRLVHFSFKEM